MKVFNKYYRYLRSSIFSTLSSSEFINVYDNFNRLRKQYVILKICTWLEKKQFPKIEFPIFRFLFMFVDFLRWKIYDFLMSIILGRQFNLYRCYYVLRSSAVLVKLSEWSNIWKE